MNTALESPGGAATVRDFRELNGVQATQLLEYYGVAPAAIPAAEVERKRMLAVRIAIPRHVAYV